MYKKEKYQKQIVFYAITGYNLCKRLHEKVQSVICAPLTGKAVPLSEVPDPVFSGKVLGDGVAVIPSDGKILSPVDGEIESVAETGHAYGFSTENGLEILVHVGLETVSLKGECFKVYVKEGDKVKKGDLVAEVDLAYLAERNINPITPVLICSDTDGQKLICSDGAVEVGKTEVLMLCAAEETTTVTPEKPKAESTETPAENTSKPEKKKKFSFNFDFLQKLEDKTCAWYPDRGKQRLVLHRSYGMVERSGGAF